MASKEDMKLFFSESEDLTQTIEESILRLEKNPKDNKPIQDLYFAFHTLKGLVGMVGLENLSKFCHQIENLLDKNKEFESRKGKIGSFVELLFESLDIIKNVLKRIKSGKKEDLDEQTIKEIMGEFQDSQGDYEIALIKPLSKEELEQIGKDKKKNFYKIYIQIQETCVFKKVRLFIIFRALNNTGKICASSPSPDLLEKGVFNLDFEIYYISDISANQITDILDEILEIENRVITSMNLKQFSDTISSLRKKEVVSESSIEAYTPYEIEGEDDVEVLSAITEDYSNITSEITSVKVKISILEKLMNYFGEVIILKNQLNQILEEKQDWGVKRLFDTMDKHFLEIQEIIFKLKLVRVESVFRRYRRLVRDVAKETGKDIDFELEGLDVEIDRKILEELNAPLVHLLRNAIYHGIEGPQKRKLKGKNSVGLLGLRTYRRAGSIFIEVSDDGKGIDYGKIRNKLVEKGQFTAEEVAELEKNQLNNIIMQPGFSTLSGADMISGRGMGLAIVQEKIKEIGGSLTIYSEPDKGTKFTLIVPFSRAILKTQLVNVRGDLFAIPIENIKQINFFNRENIEYVKGNEYYKIDGNIVPVIDLDNYLDYFIDSGQKEETVGTSKVAIWCQKDEGSSAVFVADNVLQQMELVIKPFRSRFSGFQEILGTSITGDGSICLVIDVLNIISNITVESKDLSLLESSNST